MVQLPQTSNTIKQLGMRSRGAWSVACYLNNIVGRIVGLLLFHLFTPKNENGAWQKRQEGKAGNETTTMNPYNNINNNNSMPPWMAYAMWQNSALNPANILNAGRSFAPVGGPSFAAAQQPMAGNSNYLMNANHQVIPNQFPPYAAATTAALSSVGNVPRPPPQQYLPAANANALRTTTNFPFVPAAASNSYEDDDDSVATEMSWDHPQWIPRDKNGQQKSPNKIRGELQRYIDACKAGKIFSHAVHCFTLLDNI
jgi:hypothetical protein